MIIDRQESSKRITSLTEEQLRELTLQNKPLFPDPSGGWAIERFFSGISYAFYGMLQVFRAGYIGFALFQSLYIIPIFLLFFAAVGGTTYGILMLFKPWFDPRGDTPAMFYVIFGIIIASFFLIVYGMLLLRPILAVVIEKDAHKLSYLVELQMNNYPITMRDMCCGAQGNDGPACFTFEWFKKLIFSIIDGAFRKFFLSIIHSIREQITFIIIHLAASLLLLIPGVGPILYTFIFFGLIAVQTSFIYFDMVLQRKEYTFLQTMCTIWNQMALLAGIGVGFVLLTPLFLFIFPAAIIASTTLYVHLISHRRTGKYEQWFSFFGAYALSIGSNGVSFDSLEAMRAQVESQIANNETQKLIQP